MASTTVEQLKLELGREKKIVKMLTEKLKEDREITVRQLREFADEIQRHEDNSRIATLAGSSAGIIGGGLAIAGFVGAFFTFGTTLGLIIAGGVISGVGGGTLVGTKITNAVLRSGKLKEVNIALEKDKKTTIELCEKLEKCGGIMGKIEQSSKGEIVGSVLRGTDQVCTVVQSGLWLGKAIGNEAGETVFKTLGGVGRAFHFVGFGFNVVFIALDIYTLVKTSIDVHKGNKVEIAEDIRKAAKVLEDQTIPSLVS